MKIAKTLSEFKYFRSLIPSSSVAFIPTMGNLHQGHLKLMELGKKENDFCIASIFVNPAQFSPKEDFDKYPRTMESDIEKLEKIGVNLLFAPLSTSEIYDKNHLTRVCMSKLQTANPLRNQQNEYNFLSEQPESLIRPGFFDGVSTILTKLFNITKPNTVVFGQKDAIQCIVVKQLIRDLNFDIKVIIGETDREKDGLAMSSRNQYLSPEDRKLFGPLMNKSLQNTLNFFKNQHIKFNKDVARNLVENCFKELDNGLQICLKNKKNAFDLNNFKIEYVSICDFEFGQVYGTKREEIYEEGSQEFVDNNNKKVLSLVVRVGGTRLLDNILI